jgi:hypothetical protein
VRHFTPGFMSEIQIQSGPIPSDLPRWDLPFRTVTRTILKDVPEACALTALGGRGVHPTRMTVSVSAMERREQRSLHVSSVEALENVDEYSSG